MLPSRRSRRLQVPENLGASDVTDLNWVQLMNAYTCTECGRCTSSCPASLTGKELSPRAIMMKLGIRMEEVGANIDANGGTFKDDGKQLLNDYIIPEELWACTSCNACVQECPINIDPLSIIMDMRRYLVMERECCSARIKYDDDQHRKQWSTLAIQPNGSLELERRR